ncbi:sialate O-acetylesterase [Labilibaculum manganireducens]|uniref:sialate O-acetylesterase n=1 Tax=Labilibaculum manganireducens TaxID=1940525 RepID=UPI0029F5C34F|nr:sialate O-acetylesterase [Labilibaculum manganireducens]
MYFNRRALSFILLGSLFLMPFMVSAQLRLPKLISNGLVLQRDVDVKIWGWSAKNEKVSVNYRDSLYKTIANDKGEWFVMLPIQKAGGPYVMNICASDTIHLKNILVGDVWVCSGQSNMELPMRRVSPLYKEEIAKADNRNIRYFEVPKKYNFNTVKNDLQNGNWVDINKNTINNISAVSYFFAQKLNSEYNVPIGIINSSLGGSPAQAWLNEEALKEFPSYDAELQKFKNQAVIDSIEQSDNSRSNNWYQKSTVNDEGQKENWRAKGSNTSDWSSMTIPGYWADGKLGYVNGVVWFRKEIEIPAEYCNKEGLLNMGRIIDADSVFVNGKFIGTTSYQYPPRRYTIPAGILVEGKNTISIRVISNGGRGGFVDGKPYQIVFDDFKIDLKGEWKYKLGVAMEPLQGPTFIRWKSGGLYNAMIAPLLNYKIKGAVWYQGESNTGRPNEYEHLLSSLIKNWRKQWGQGDFPFLCVQLPNFMSPKDQPSESNWAMLREAQFKALSVPNTGMAVTIDIGEWNDIHPLNKKDVGERLVLVAKRIAYGDDHVVYSGPMYRSMKVEKNKVILFFDQIGSGLIVKGGGELKEFAIAGKDKKFVWAKAKIVDNKVIVWSDKVKKPLAVRYAWADNPESANLFNKEKLPASPFRTDTW